MRLRRSLPAYASTSIIVRSPSVNKGGFQIVTPLTRAPQRRFPHGRHRPVGDLRNGAMLAAAPPPETERPPVPSRFRVNATRPEPKW